MWSTIERMYSQTLINQVNTAQTNVSALDTYYTQIKQIDNMLADKEAGLTPLMQKFFDAAQSVATNPSSISARQSMVSAAEALVARFQSMDERMTEIEAGINSQVRDTVGQINTYTEQIADLNEKIISASAIGGQPANDLLDQARPTGCRPQQAVKVTATSNSDGSYNVFVGNGQQLVIGSQVTKMVGRALLGRHHAMVVGVRTPGGVQELPES